MSRSCQDFREDLRLCIVASECMKGGRSFHDCLKTPENLDDKCRTVLGAYKQCRMNWVRLLSAPPPWPSSGAD